MTRDGGATWTSVEGNVQGVPGEHLGARRSSRRRTPPGTAFVVFDNHRRSDWTPYVYRTDDYGKSWRSLATPALRGYALAIVQDPVDPRPALPRHRVRPLGLARRRQAAGRRWSTRRSRPSRSWTSRSTRASTTWSIATHGRALYVLDDIRPLRALSAQVVGEKLHLFPVADASSTGTLGEDGGFGFGAGEFRGENRPYGALVTFWRRRRRPAASRPRDRTRAQGERAPSESDRDGQGGGDGGEGRSQQELGRGEAGRRARCEREEAG